MALEKPSFENMPFLLLEVQENQKKLLKQFSDLQKSFEQNSQPNQKEFLTIEEAAAFLGVNRSTLHRWEKDDVITAYGIEKRRYFKYSELTEKIVPLKK